MMQKTYLQYSPCCSLKLVAKSLQYLRLWSTASGPWVPARFSTFIFRSLLASNLSAFDKSLIYNGETFNESGYSSERAYMPKVVQVLITSPPNLKQGGPS